MQKTIFVVDDSLSNLSLVEETLGKYYRVITLSSAGKLHNTLNKLIPDLILLDVAMPDESGFDAMKKLKSNKLYADIPVIFLSALTDVYNESLGFKLGAVDFITKPFSEPVLINRVKNHLQIDTIIKERTAQLTILKHNIVSTMSNIVESRDKHTEGHVERLKLFTKILLESMIKHDIYADSIKQLDMDLFVSSVCLHDVGKIYVPDSILNKPESLTEEEFEIVKTHTTEGERIIDQMTKQTGEAEFLQSAKLVAAYHHERWDGTGYPYKLKETDIPLPGRITAIIDVYDALISDRPYRKAKTHEEAVGVINSEAGSHFDPVIVEAFSNASDLFRL